MITDNIVTNECQITIDWDERNISPQRYRVQHRFERNGEWNDGGGYKALPAPPLKAHGTEHLKATTRAEE